MLLQIVRLSDFMSRCARYTSVLLSQRAGMDSTRLHCDAMPKSQRLWSGYGSWFVQRRGEMWLAAARGPPAEFEQGSFHVWFVLLLLSDVASFDAVA